MLFPRDAIRGLTELKNFTMQNSRPANYMGCNSGTGGNDLKNSSLPAGFFTLSKLESVDFECNRPSWPPGVCLAPAACRWRYFLRPVAMLY